MRNLSIGRLVAVLALCTALLQLWGYVASQQDFWFNPHVCTDDAFQQAYPFHEANHPGLFEGDLPTRMMKSYLPPLHYALWWGVTKITADPLLTGHWVMLIQVAITLVALFTFAMRTGGFATACLSVAWLLNTRVITGSMNGGLPRGWVAPLLALFLLLVSLERHRTVLIVLLAACLVSPTAAFTIGTAYGLYLASGLVRLNTRLAARSHLLGLLLISPLALVCLLALTRMDPSIGEMASYERALSMPEFQKGGRFPFVPFVPWWQEVRKFFFLGFESLRYRPDVWVRNILPFVVAGFLVLAAWQALGRKKSSVPGIVWCLIVAALICFTTAREFAFFLYVPNRYLQVPAAIALIAAFTTGIARLAQDPVKEFAAYIAVILFIILSSGAPLALSPDSHKPGGENQLTEKRLWHFFREKTPDSSVVAGELRTVDPVPLFGMRRVYVSHETAQPFYDRYYETMAHRIRVTLQAHFAENVCDFLSLVAPEKIDYFVFEKKKFTRSELNKVSYFRPYDIFVRQILDQRADRFAVRELSAYHGAIAFKNERVIVVDVSKLRERAGPQCP